jgi:hypothetical protein
MKREQIESLRKESVIDLELSPRTKESVTASELQKFSNQLKALSKRKNLHVLVIEI